MMNAILIDHVSYRLWENRHTRSIKGDTFKVQFIKIHDILPYWNKLYAFDRAGPSSRSPNFMIGARNYNASLELR